MGRLIKEMKGYHFLGYLGPCFVLGPSRSAIAFYFSQSTVAIYTSLVIKYTGLFLTSVFILYLVICFFCFYFGKDMYCDECSIRIRINF